MSKLKKPAQTGEPIHQLITHRWSPRIFEDRPVEPEKLRSLFEAARWAASSYNAQPWSFIVATKDDAANYQRVLDTFVEFNQGWAKSAPVLALSGLGELLSRFASTPWRGFWQGLVLTLLMALTVSVLTRRKIYWRT